MHFKKMPCFGGPEAEMASNIDKEPGGGSQGGQQKAGGANIDNEPGSH